MEPRLGALFTYANSEDSNRDALTEATRRGLPVILDSGAWSVFNRGAVVDPLAQARFVAQAQLDYPQARFLALDVIGATEATWANWVLQRSAGARVEPTLHYPEHPKLLTRYLEAGLAAMPDGRPWVNLGGLVAQQGRPPAHRQVAAWTAAVRRELPPEVRLHGLGTVTPAVNDLVRFDGVDSSYWLVSLKRFRTLPLFDPGQRRWVRMLLASARPEYERESRQHLHLAAKVLRAHYGTTPAAVWLMEDEERLGLSLRSHAYFADAYRARHGHPDAPVVYLAGAPTKSADPVWPAIERWSLRE